MIPTYLFIISLSFSIGVVWVSRRALRGKMDHKFALDLGLAFMIGSMVGARLFHVFYERPDIYLADPIRLFQVWRGGFVYYGGFIGALALCLALLRWRRQPFLPWADLFAPVLSFGYALGRIACFMAGCCFGRECHYPWAVHFPEGVEAPAGVPLHPTQLYASLWEWGVLALLLGLERRSPRLPPGSLFFVWLIGHGAGRIIMEHFRADFRGPEALGLSISTLISLALLGAGLAGLVHTRRALNVSGTF